MTIKNSGEYRVETGYYDLFGSEEKLEKLKKKLNSLKSSGHVIYINTRAYAEYVRRILKNVNILVGDECLIKCVYGSQTVEEIQKPFTLTELNEYGLLGIENTYVLWSVKKVTFLNLISTIESIPKSNILFFDDLSVNVNTAKMNGYKNSFLIGSDDSGLYGLDFLLIKLDQIIDLFKIKI